MLNERAFACEVLPLATSPSVSCLCEIQLSLVFDSELCSATEIVPEVALIRAYGHARYVQVLRVSQAQEFAEQYFEGLTDRQALDSAFKSAVPVLYIAEAAASEIESTSCNPFPIRKSATTTVSRDLKWKWYHSP